MFKNWTRDIVLAIQARSGLTPALVVWAAVALIGAATAFVFLCVALYDWLSLLLNNVIAGLAVAGIFAVIAAVGAIAGAMARRRAKARAMLERAARAHAPSGLLDPKIIGPALQAARALGWQRLVPIAFLGFLAAQWAREHHEESREAGG
jgi:hypothetical protein